MEAWAPLSLDPKQNTRTDHFLPAIARLRPGVTLAQGRAEIESIIAGIRRRFPDTSADQYIRVIPLREQLTGEYAPALTRLLGAVGFVLAIACANIANLLFARGAGRQREVAIRAALGAARSRVVRQLVTESSLVAIAGGALGLLLSAVALRALVRSAPIDLPWWLDLGPDATVLGFTLLLMAVAVVLFAALPALRTSRVDLTASLKESGARSGASAGVLRLREWLVVGEVALCLVLLVGAGLMIRSFLNLQSVQTGFQPSNVLTFRLALPEDRYKEPHQIEGFYRGLQSELSALPGVIAVGATSTLPFANGWWRTFSASPAAKQRFQDLPMAYYGVVTPGFVSALGVPLRRGRDFTEADDSSHPAIIISERLARKHFPGVDPVGRRLRVDPVGGKEPWRTIVGVIGDVQTEDLRKEPGEVMFVAGTFSSMTVAIRTSGNIASLVPAVRQQVRKLDSELPLFGIRTMENVVARSTWQARFFTLLFTVFAGIAVLIASVGLGGVVAYAVTQRTHEIGVRLAVGARATDVVRLVARRALLLTAAGVIAGSIAAALLTRVLERMLFNVRSTDAVTFVAVTGVLLAVAAVASFAPAIRAARVDPVIALRYE
jgi:putative ABC transport system permease protein